MSLPLLLAVGDRIFNGSWLIRQSHLQEQFGFIFVGVFICLGSSNSVHFQRFWSFSPMKEEIDKERENTSKSQKWKKGIKDPSAVKPANGVWKRRVRRPSAHGLQYYTANRVESDEIKNKTFLPYRQGLLGCLGFGSKCYSGPIDSPESDLLPATVETILDNT